MVTNRFKSDDFSLGLKLDMEYFIAENQLHRRLLMLDIVLINY
jgi:hypothetical protein